MSPELDQKQWLLETDAPIALPLRPFADGYRGANGTVSRAQSRAADGGASRTASRAASRAGPPVSPLRPSGSRPASRGVPNVAFDVGDGPSYPASSAAASIYRGVTSAAAERRIRRYILSTMTMTHRRRRSRRHCISSSCRRPCRSRMGWEAR